jgi:hypothetical protein
MGSRLGSSPRLAATELYDGDSTCTGTLLQNITQTCPRIRKSFNLPSNVVNLTSEILRIYIPKYQRGAVINTCSQFPENNFLNR